MNPRTTLISALTALAALWALPACDAGPTYDIAPEVVSFAVVPGMLGEGVFVDAPVQGLVYVSPSVTGVTDTEGRFDYRYAESLTFYVGVTELGTAQGQPALSPVDLVPLGSVEHPVVIQIARVLQSLDADRDPTNGINVTAFVTDLLDATLAQLGLAAVDFTDEAGVDVILAALVDRAAASGLLLTAVDTEAAKNCLIAGLAGASLLRMNVTATPELATSKGKLDVVMQRTAGQRADGTPLGREVLPLVMVYNDEIDGAGGAQDVFGAVSLDDGETWRRWNLSRSATRSSYVLANGEPYPGHTTKASAQVKGRYLFASWTSRFCPATDPSGFGEGVADRYGVAGAQKSIDYAAIGYPEVGEVPFGCLWVIRGQVAPNGAVTWLAPEQVSSGHRDALQNFSAGNGSVGFAVAWQEDPAGLKPGDGEGPGHGWSGAVTNKQTDIWYTFVRWADFLATDPDYVPADDVANVWGWNRPAVAMASPVRVTDNAACKHDDIFVDEDAADPWDDDNVHGNKPDEPSRPDTCGKYDDKGKLIVTYPFCADYCVAEDADGFCVDADGRALDGNTGASRPNLFIVPVTLPDGSKTGTVVLGYEESKGLGKFDPNEEGKTIQYHSFPRFDAPAEIAAGDTLSLRTSDGGYENARRIRFLVQPPEKAGPSDTRIIALYKQGEEGQGRPSDIMLRRAVGGYGFANFEVGALNISSATPSLDADGCLSGYERTVENLADSSADNPLDDARAHRGQLRGDRLVVGFSWTPLWGNARVGLDKYDFFVMRSFDGGQTFTNAAGDYEPPRNMSNLPDATWTVIEPRIVGTPPTIKRPDGTPTGYADDVNAPDVYFLAWGTATNDPFVFEESAVPADLYFGRTEDFGETYECVPYVDPDTGAQACGFRPLAVGPEDAGECQMRMTPSGDTYWATWHEGIDGLSDMILRRVDYE